MPHRLPAAVLIQPGCHPDKQRTLCLEYAETSGLRAITLCHNSADCVALVKVGKIKAVITAVNPGGTLADDIARWGGQLHIVRDKAPSRTTLPDVGDLARGMYRSGLDTTQISTILRLPPEQVRRHRNQRRHE